MKHVKHYKDIGFTVVAEPHYFHVEYLIYEIEGDSVDGNPLYHRKGSDSFPDSVDTIEESEPYLTGEVKWDGCSNWEFDEQERSMLHFCSRENLQSISEIMVACYDWTKELLPSFRPADVNG